MRIRDHFELAVHGVFSSLFSLLSNTVSVLIGLLLFGGLISLSLGAGNFLEKYYSRTISLTTLLVFHGPGGPEFDQAYRTRLESIPGVKRVFFHQNDFVEMQVGQGKVVTVALRSAVANDPEIERLEMIAGATLPVPTNPLEPAVVLSALRAGQLFDGEPRALVGAPIEITFMRGTDTETEFERESVTGRVVGIVNESPSNSAYVHYAVLAIADRWMQTSSPGGEVGESTSVSFSGTAGAPSDSPYLHRTLDEAWQSVHAAVADDSVVYPHLRIHAANLKTLVRLRKSFRQQGIPTASTLDDVAAIRDLRHYAMFVGSLLGGITIVAACCSVFNTLLASVERRTREIGLLRAIGASTGNILAIFLLEGAIHALVGGVVAALALIAGAATANHWLMKALEGNRDFAKLIELQPQLFTVPVWLPPALLGIGVGAALLASLIPAIRACYIQPHVALRHE